MSLQRWQEIDRINRRLAGILGCAPHEVYDKTVQVLRTTSTLKAEIKKLEEKING